MFRMTVRLIVNRVLQFGLFYFFLQVAPSTSELPQLTFVTRNVSDSFHFQEANCVDESSVCSDRNALCQSDGSCLCRNTTPDYVSPKFVVTHGYLGYGNSDGCMAVTSIISSLDADNLACSHSFGPYQVIPNQPMTPATKFIHTTGAQYSYCNFSSALAKQPGKKTWIPLTWLNELYVNITAEFPGYLYFQWQMSVPKLHGLMVVINLDCSKKYETLAFGNFTQSRQCIRAKVLGRSASTRLGHTVNYFPTAILGLFLILLTISI